MQLAYQLGISRSGERTICSPYGAGRWTDLSAADAEALTWSLRAALLWDLDHGATLREPESRFYEPGERPITSATIASWRRRLQDERTYPNDPEGSTR